MKAKKITFGKPALVRPDLNDLEKKYEDAMKKIEAERNKENEDSTRK